MRFLSHHLVAGRVRQAREIGRVALVIFIFHERYLATFFQTCREQGGVVLQVFRGEGYSVAWCRVYDQKETFQERLKLTNAFPSVGGQNFVDLCGRNRNRTASCTIEGHRELRQVDLHRTDSNKPAVNCED